MINAVTEPILITVLYGICNCTIMKLAKLEIGVEKEPMHVNIIPPSTIPKMSAQAVGKTEK